MRTLILILTSLAILSCGTNSTTVSKSQSDFQALVSNLRALETGYSYDLVKQDAEGSYNSNEKLDTLFYNPPRPIVGQFNNGTIFSLIHFEPGDDLAPVIRTFDSEGKLIDNMMIPFGNCAAGDCEFDDCDEKFTLINQNTIENIITLVTTPCDSLGNKDPKQSKKEVWKRTITVDEKGKLTAEEEKS
jgi:hypothetical protein